MLPSVPTCRLPLPLLAAALVFVGACAHLPKTRPSPLAADHLDAGIKALDAGDLDRAEAELHLALEYQPRQPETHVGLGLVALARGDRKIAHAYFTMALRLDGDCVEASSNLGALAMEDGDLDRAARHLRAALDVDPGYAPARHNLARTLHRMGQLDAARAEYLVLTSVARDDADAWAELAAIELAVGEKTAAGRAARVALELAPGQLGAQRVLANLLRDAGELEQALAAYDAIVAASPSDALVLIDRAVARSFAGRGAEAMTDAERAVALAPELAAAHFALGAVASRVGDDERAAAELARAEELADGDGRAYLEATYLRAAALARLGRRREAAATYRTFVAQAEGIPALADAIEMARAELRTLPR